MLTRLLFVIRLLPGVVEAAKAGGHKCIDVAVQTAVSLLTSLQQIADMKDIDHEVLERLSKGVVELKNTDVHEQTTGHGASSISGSNSITVPLPESESADISNSVSQFVESIAAVIPALLEAPSTHAVDEALQSCASKFFLVNLSDDRETERQSFFLNADSVYAASYAVLMLSLQLLSSGFYEEAKTPAFMLQVC